MDWVKTQNAITDKVLHANPIFAPLSQKYLEAFDNKDKIAYPNIVGAYVYNLWQDEKNERGVWRRMKESDYVANKTTWEVVLDIDALSKAEGKSWVFEGATWLEPDNMLCLLELSDGGKDENEIREFDAKSKTFVKGGFHLKESKGGVSWVDKNNLLVHRDFGKETLTDSGYPRQVKLWTRGTDIASSKLVFETEAFNLGAMGTSLYYNNKQHLFIYNRLTFFTNDFYSYTDGKVKQIVYPKDARLVGFHKGEAVFNLQSDWNLNNKIFKAGSVVSFNISENLAGKTNLKLVYEPNDKSSFIEMSSSKDFVIINIVENVQSKLICYMLKNEKWVAESIQAPAFGSIGLITSSDQSNDYFFTFSNFITPATLYWSNGKEIKIAKKQRDYFNTEGLVVNQYMAKSKDGTSIPYFIVHQKDIKHDGSNPTIIDAYGGFNISSQPDYSIVKGLGWLEKGGVIVLANIRGGGEFGPAWHQAAMKEKRQNAYDDFFAVSEDLINRKITSPKHLGAFGWSNGGLLMGVVFTQRPELYQAVVVGAPLLDMKRYSKMLAGASWMGEYGNPDIPEEWNYIKKYSPYHNVSKDKKYPEVFFLTSTKDDRVHPAHARKMAAKMHDLGHPYFYHETTEGGHGAASTNKQVADMWASIYTYYNMKLR